MIHFSQLIVSDINVLALAILVLNVSNERYPTR